MVRRLALALALSVAIGCRSTPQPTKAPPSVPPAETATRTAREITAPPGAHATEAAALAPPAASTAQVMRVHFIDIGQGAATLIEFSEETTFIDRKRELDVGGNSRPSSQAGPPDLLGGSRHG